jgi:predicted ATPase
VLSHDASDLAAALETILEIGDQATLERVIAEAFRGAKLRIDASETLFSLYLDIPGLLRPLTAREFSDGQLRFLCLCAALLSPRPACLIAFNEPETSLHPDLYRVLAQLIAGRERVPDLGYHTFAQSGRTNRRPLQYATGGANSYGRRDVGGWKSRHSATSLPS